MSSETMQNYKIAAALYSIKFYIASSIAAFLLGLMISIAIMAFSETDPMDAKWGSLFTALFPLSFVINFFIIRWLARKPSVRHNAQAHAFALWATVTYLLLSMVIGLLFSRLINIEVGMFETILSCVALPVFFYYVTKHFVGKQPASIPAPSVAA